MSAPPTQPMHKCERHSDEIGDRPAHLGLGLFSYQIVCGFFNIPQITRNKTGVMRLDWCYETGPIIYRTHLRRLDCRKSNCLQHMLPGLGCSFLFFSFSTSDYRTNVLTM